MYDVWPQIKPDEQVQGEVGRGNGGEDGILTAGSASGQSHHLIETGLGCDAHERAPHTSTISFARNGVSSFNTS